jgi:hypothetical protein
MRGDEDEAYRQCIERDDNAGKPRLANGFEEANLKPRLQQMGKSREQKGGRDDGFDGFWIHQRTR